MKRTILMMAAMLLAVPFAMKAQTPSSQTVTFYGIDFSEVRVLGASESASEFVNAFREINELFLSETDKYIGTLSRRLDSEVNINLDPVLEAIDDIDKEDLKVNATPQEWRPEKLVSSLQALGIEPREGTGLVAFAFSLEKGRSKGTYYFVFFDNATMKITETYKITGAAGGSGLRNYWANSFYRCESELNPSKFHQKAQGLKNKISAKVDTLKRKL